MMSKLALVLLFVGLAACFPPRWPRSDNELGDDSEVVIDLDAFDPNNPQADLGGFFSSFLGTIFDGVCDPICQGYYGCRIAAMLHPGEFNRDQCELHLLSMPCQCKNSFRVSFRPGSGKVSIDNRPVGESIPINYPTGMGDPVVNERRYYNRLGDLM